MSTKTTRAIVPEKLPTELKTILENVIDMALDDLQPGDELSTLGLDSVMLLEIMVTLERTYGLKFQQEDLARITSINDMSALLIEKSGSLAESV